MLLLLIILGTRRGDKITSETSAVAVVFSFFFLCFSKDGIMNIAYAWMLIPPLLHLFYLYILLYLSQNLLLKTTSVVFLFFVFINNVKFVIKDILLRQKILSSFYTSIWNSYRSYRFAYTASELEYTFFDYSCLFTFIYILLQSFRGLRLFISGRKLKKRCAFFFITQTWS